MSWSKCISGDCNNGYGVYEKKGFNYKGEWKDKQLNGKGELKTPANEADKNQPASGLTYSKNITNYVTYQGTFLNGKIQGYALVKYSNGDTYEAEFKSGGRWSRVISYTDPLGSIYTGEFDRLIPKNSVNIEHKDGSRYIGNMSNMLYQGKGSLEYIDGSGYEGEFNQGKFDGEGTFTNANGELISGIYKNGKYSGTVAETRELKAKIEAIKYKDFKSSLTHIRCDVQVENYRYSINDRPSKAPRSKVKYKFYFAFNEDYLFHRFEGLDFLLEFNLAGYRYGSEDKWNSLGLFKGNLIANPKPEHSSILTDETIKYSYKVSTNIEAEVFDEILMFRGMDFYYDINRITAEYKGSMLQKYEEKYEKPSSKEDLLKIIKIGGVQDKIEMIEDHKGSCSSYNPNQRAF